MTGTGGNGWGSFSFGPEGYTDGSDPISRIACRIILRFPDLSSAAGGLIEGYQSPASGFLVWHDGGFFLATNWHCLAGRNAFEQEIILSTKGALPSHVVIDLTHLGIHDRQPRPLYDEACNPLWRQHPKRDTEIADLVALPLAGLPADTPALFKPGFAIDRTGDPLPLSVGEDVFVVGFPRAIGNGAWPVWKRASLASEPTQSLRLAGDPDRPLRAVLADGAFMEGLSGSLAIRKTAFPATLTEKRLIRPLYLDRQGTPFWYSPVGVYSGRAPDPKPEQGTPGEEAKCKKKASAGPSDEEELAKARLGIVWKAELLLEVLRHGVRGRG